MFAMQGKGQGMQIGEQSVRAHYGELLGVGEQWEVVRVEIDHAQRLIEAWASWCKGGGLDLSTVPRDLPRLRPPSAAYLAADGCLGGTTLLHACVPRCRCEHHGVISVRACWAEPGSRFTLAFERHAIDVLSAASSLSEAAGLLRLDWDAAHRIQRRAVERGMARRAAEPTAYIGIDEKSFGRGQSYGCVVSDLNGRRVLEVVQNRDEQAACKVLEELPPVLRQSVQAVAMDMWKPFINAAAHVLPDADIVFDKFHIVRLLHDGVDRVCRQEHRHLTAQGDDDLIEACIIG